MKGYKYITPILLSEVQVGDIIKTKPELVHGKAYLLTTPVEEGEWYFYKDMNGGTVEYVDSTVNTNLFVPIYFIEGVYRKITELSEEYCPYCGTYHSIEVKKGVKGQTWKCPECHKDNFACSTCATVHDAKECKTCGVYRKTTELSEEYCPNCDSFHSVNVEPDKKGQAWICPSCGQKSIACNVCPDHTGCQACCDKNGVL